MQSTQFVHTSVRLARKRKKVICIFRHKDPISFNVCDKCAECTMFQWALRRGLQFGMVKRISSGSDLCDGCEIVTKGV